MGSREKQGRSLHPAQTQSWPESQALFSPGSQGRPSSHLSTPSVTHLSPRALAPPSLVHLLGLYLFLKPCPVMVGVRAESSRQTEGPQGVPEHSCARASQECSGASPEVSRPREAGSPQRPALRPKLSHSPTHPHGEQLTPTPTTVPSQKFLCAVRTPSTCTRQPLPPLSPPPGPTGLSLWNRKLALSWPGESSFRPLVWTWGAPGAGGRAGGDLHRTKRWIL